MKEKKDELSNDKTKYNGISEFLKNAGINDFSESEKVKYKINQEISELKNRLSIIKNKSFEDIDNTLVKELNSVKMCIRDSIEAEAKSQIEVEISNAKLSYWRMQPFLEDISLFLSNT